MKKWMSTILAGVMTLALSLSAIGSGEALAASANWPQTLDYSFGNLAKSGKLRGCNVKIGDTREQAHKALGKPYEYGGTETVNKWEKYTDCSVTYSSQQRVQEIISPLSQLTKKVVLPFPTLKFAGVETIMGSPSSAGIGEKTYDLGDHLLTFTALGEGVKQVKMWVPQDAMNRQFSVRDPKAPSQTRVFLDDKLLSLSTPAVERNDRMLVPLRGVLEALGTQVTWDDGTQTALVRTGTKTIHVTINSNLMKVYHDGYPDSYDFDLDVPAQLINNRTMIPLRAVSDAVGAFVGWVERDNAVYLYSPLTGVAMGSDDVYGNSSNPIGPGESEEVGEEPGMPVPTSQGLPQTQEINGVSVTVTDMEILATETVFHVQIENNSEEAVYLLAGMSQMTSAGKKTKHQGDHLDPALISTIEPNRSSEGTITIPGVPSDGFMLFETKLYGMKDMLEFPIAF